MNRPIVYGARYYLPGRRKSHFHIWRCEPDGSRRLQISDGAWDDASPAWSPDGKRIAFVRADRQVCLVDADGGRVRGVWSAPEFLWGVRWVDGATLETNDEQPVRIRIATGATTSAPPDDDSRVTLPNGTRVHARSPQTLEIVGRRGETHIVTIQWPKEIAEELVEHHGVSVWTLPGDAARVLVGYVRGESTFGHFRECYRVSLANGAATHWGAHNGLHWSPDGKRFCTTLTRDYPEFDKRPTGETRTVEVCPLYVADRRHPDKPIPIVQGFVYVDGCDWKPH